MANLKEIKKRIQSIHSTMQITSAMKMVSASKLKKAQNATEQLRPYTEKLKNLIVAATGSTQTVLPLMTQRPLQKVLIIAISSNRGLCGAFNNNIIKETLRQQNLYPQVEVLAFGKKAFDGLNKKVNFPNQPFDAKDYNIFEDFNFNKVRHIARLATDAFLNQKYDGVLVIYNHFKNVMTQMVKTEHFLPLQSLGNQHEETDYLFEPGKQELLEQLIPKALYTHLYSLFLDHLAAEHAARMTAMHKATDNAKELKKHLTIAFNKARQAAITQEISEIVSGAQALQ